jgi:hypothetical protein
MVSSTAEIAASPTNSKEIPEDSGGAMPAAAVASRSDIQRFVHDPADGAGAAATLGAAA